MQTLKIRDDVAAKLNEISEKEHIQPPQLIEKLIEQYMQNKVLMTDLMNDLPTIKAFEGNPAEIQQRMRDEWDA